VHWNSQQKHLKQKTELGPWRKSTTKLRVTPAGHVFVVLKETIEILFLFLILEKTRGRCRRRLQVSDRSFGLGRYRWSVSGKK
jgi:hypothetical protein